MVRLKIFMVILLLGVLWQPAFVSLLLLRPNDVRFIKMRCRSYYPTAITSGQVSVWRNPMVAEHTYCYTKCLLYRLGLIDLQTLGLDPLAMETIRRRLRRYPFSSCMRVYMWTALSGLCVDYYNARMAFAEKCPEISNVIFNGNDTDHAVHALNENTRIRKIGEQPTRFCYENFKRMPKHTNWDKSVLLCTYTEFHFFDAYGRINEEELRLAFEESNLSAAAVKRCAREANRFYTPRKSQEMAFQLRKCLWNEVGENLNIVITARDLLMARF